MAITRLFQSGFELGDWSEWTGSSVPQSQVSSSSPKTGVYTARLGSASSSANTGYVYKSVPATRQLRVGFNLYISTEGAASPLYILALKSSGGTVLAGISLSSTNIVGGAGSATDTEVGAGPTSVWMHIGFDVKIDSSAGWVKVYKDGIEITSATGNTGNTDIAYVYLGCGLDGNEWQSLIYVDDVYIDDTTGEGSAAALPIKAFKYITPDGAGNYTQFTPSAGSNYQCVDEKPPTGDTDYVYVTSGDAYDSYTMTTQTLGVGESCIAVIPLAVVKRSGATEQIALGTRYSSTDVIGSDQTPGSSYYEVVERQTTKPGGGDWDQTALDGLEVVIKSRGSY